MSAATILRFGDLDTYRRLSALVAQLEDLVRRTDDAEALAARLTVLEEATVALIDDVQARLPWVLKYQERWHDTGWPRGRRRTRPPAAVSGNWRGTRTRVQSPATRIGIRDRSGSR